MILVTATARLQPAAREDALAAARRMRELTTQEEGCREYSFWIALDEPDSILLFERWEDAASLEAHLAAPHTAEFGAAIGTYCDGPVEVTRYEVAD
jgi:quinol monooxygenase YgiN